MFPVLYSDFMENIYYPEYYKNFNCIASMCPDTCCAGWEICIDDNAYKLYSEQNSEFGLKLKENITIDKDGDRIFSLKNGRCPFLNADNLCDIYINLGEKSLCEVCREHPRFTEIYDGFTEISLSVSCPEVNRIIFSKKYNADIYPLPESDGEDAFLSELIINRKALFDALANQSIVDFSVNLKQTCRLIQKKFDFCELSSYDFIYNFSTDFLLGTEKFILSETEILTSIWREKLNSSIKSITDICLFKDFISANTEGIKQAIAYFIYRYFLKSVNDCDIELIGAFIMLSITVCIDISIKTKTDFCECIRIYSKEIEHNLDNIELIKNHIYDMGNKVTTD